MITFSPGLVQGCLDLLEIVQQNTLTFPQIQESFSYMVGLPTTRVVETAQTLNWVYASEEGIVRLTSSGERLQSLSGYEAMLRQALLDYIDIERPAWLQNAMSGRLRVIQFAGNQIGQIFVEAGLADGTDDEIVSFWDAMAAAARGQKNSRLTLIGREGERLTIIYEEKRTGRKPKWVAVDNNEDGYDVLSTVAAEDPRSLSIEVKSSTIGLSGAVHLSRNEWDRALEAENHIFHLWNIHDRLQPLLAIISTAEIESHIPSDRGVGSWQNAEIPFKAFQEHFRNVPMV